jgi:hypothetical protein
MLSVCFGLQEIVRNFQIVDKDFSSASSASCFWFQHVGSLRKRVFMAKQTRITIETDSLLILRGRNSRRTWCPQCEADREMIALENLGVISNLERSVLEEWLNSGELHQSQSANGSILICLNSLLARMQNTQAS